MTELVGRIIKNRYRVDKSLGRGGMAEVYKIWDSERNTTLAMKVMHEDFALDSAFLRRFQREAQTLRDLQHPNIVRFYELDQDGRLLFMLMDYVDGESLKHKIFDARGPLPFDQVMAVMRPLCQALQYAHNKGYIHADVKPGNVMIDQNGRVMLADFGIARLAESATVTMLGAGTPAYMSPEQARGKPISPQTDIYALGIILYEMLAGERPFTGEQAKTGSSTSEKIRWEQLNLNPVSPRRFNRQVESGLDAVVMRCLEKDARARFASPLELLNALEKALPITASSQPFAAPAREEPAKPASAPSQPANKAEPIKMPARPRKIQTSPIAWLIGGVLIISVLFLGGRYAFSPALPTSTPTATQIPTTTPTHTFTPTATELPPTITPTPALIIGSTQISPKDDMVMVFVPAGNFEMGSDNGDGDEKPVHTVYLDDFWMDQTEVTNKQYATCVSAGACQEPASTRSYTQSSYYGNSKFDNYPVIYVKWDQANAYCSWAGRRLPTEAEWEKAARGTQAFTYPWGNEATNSGLLNYNGNVGDTTEVGSYPDGASMYGALDMAGNVWEWVSSLYQPYPYSAGDGRENLSASGSRVLRGGAGDSLENNVRSAGRGGDDPSYTFNNVGFRCALSLP